MTDSDASAAMAALRDADDEPGADRDAIARDMKRLVAANPDSFGNYFDDPDAE